MPPDGLRQPGWRSRCRGWARSGLTLEVRPPQALELPANPKANSDQIDLEGRATMDTSNHTCNLRPVFAEKLKLEPIRIKHITRRGATVTRVRRIIGRPSSRRCCRPKEVVGLLLSRHAPRNDRRRGGGGGASVCRRATATSDGVGGPGKFISSPRWENAIESLPCWVGYGLDRNATPIFASLPRISARERRDPRPAGGGKASRWWRASAPRRRDARSLLAHSAEALSELSRAATRRARRQRPRAVLGAPTHTDH